MCASQRFSAPDRIGRVTVLAWNDVVDIALVSSFVNFQQAAHIALVIPLLFLNK